MRSTHVGQGPDELEYDPGQPAERGRVPATAGRKRTSSASTAERLGRCYPALTVATWPISGGSWPGGGGLGDVSWNGVWTGDRCSWRATVGVDASPTY